MLFKKVKDIVGIDIGSSAIKLVQLRENKGGYHLVNIGMVPLPPEAIVDNSLMDTSSIVEALKSLIHGLNVKVKSAAASISGSSVIIRKISLPAMTEEELEDQIQWEAEQYIPFDINDVNLDFQILETSLTDASKMNVLLVASKKEIINDYVTVFAEAGLKLDVMDVDAFAVQNTYEINHEVTPDEVVALVNIGANVTNLNIIKEGLSLFTRDIQMGGNLYNEEIQRQFGIKGDEAEHLKIHGGGDDPQKLRDVVERIGDSIAMEIRRSIDFYISTAVEEKVHKLFLCGGAAKTAGLLEAVAQRLGVPVALLDPLHRVHFSEKEFDPEYLREIGPFVAVATGLATRRLGDK
jgi:type IV pilus assembly protein PilM